MAFPPGCEVSSGVGQDGTGCVYAGPHLARADQRDANIAAQAQRAIGLQPSSSHDRSCRFRHRRSCRRPSCPAPRRLEPVHERQPAKRRLRRGGIGVLEVQPLRVRVVGLDPEPGQSAAQRLAAGAAVDLDDPGFLLGQPVPLGRGGSARRPPTRASAPSSKRIGRKSLRIEQTTARHSGGKPKAAPRRRQQFGRRQESVGMEHACVWSVR